MGQAPVIHYIPTLYEWIVEGKFDPTDIITNRLPLDEAQYAYEIFDEKKTASVNYPPPTLRLEVGASSDLCVFAER